MGPDHIIPPDQQTSHYVVVVLLIIIIIIIIIDFDRMAHKESGRPLWQLACSLEASNGVSFD